MKPRRPQNEEGQGELWRTELARMVNPEHEMVKLSAVIDWAGFEDAFGESYAEGTGRPGIPTRLMVALHWLKYTQDLSDEEVVRHWVENPYWQYLSGMRWFEHEAPIDPSSMTRWRGRIGERGAEELLGETVRSGLQIKAIKPSQIKRINVDTTVQEKNIRHPTDARLYERAITRLGKEAGKGTKLRQTFARVAKRTLFKINRLSHTRKPKQAAAETRKLRHRLGRLIRDIDRKIPRPWHKLARLLEPCRRILHQRRKDKDKTYSVHEPHVECIAKGKAHKKYEFGCKAGVAVTSKGGWLVGAKAFHGNPYDGHTLAGLLAQVKRILAKLPLHAYADRAYRGHDYQEGEVEIHIDKTTRGKTSLADWRWLKRRAAVEPTIGHLKSDRRLDRNRLKGPEGDRTNILLSAAGMNFAKLLKHLRHLCALLIRWLMASLYPLLPSNLRPLNP